MLSQAFPQPGGESSPVTSVAQGAFLLLIFSSLDGKTINIIIREINYFLDFLDVYMFIHHPSKFGKFSLKISGEIILRIVHCDTGVGPSKIKQVREAPLKLLTKAFGHCPNSDCPPPPHSASE